MRDFVINLCLLLFISTNAVNISSVEKFIFIIRVSISETQPFSPPLLLLIYLTQIDLNKKNSLSRNKKKFMSLFIRERAYYFFRRRK